LLHSGLRLAPVLGLVAVAVHPFVDRVTAWHALARRLDVAGRASASCSRPVAADRVFLRGDARGLASWQTVGGCGAGASTGTGAGVKWIGRNVRGGLVHVECQANYVKVPYGYNFVGTAAVTHDLTPQWNLGVSVPYLYKYMNDPYQVGVDLANKGAGDVSLLVSRRLGDTNDWMATAALGVPTGTHQIKFRTETLPQDRQLGLGTLTATLVLDHTIDHLWGPVVVGASASWRGGKNEVGSYRAPSASAYSYVSYLVGPFAPAAGISLTGFLGNDRDLGQDQALPAVSAAANVSIEWATDWLALLVGASLPYDFAVHGETTATTNRFGAWILALGAAFTFL
jgi:hypothetical protein